MARFVGISKLNFREGLFTRLESTAHGQVRWPGPRPRSPRRAYSSIQRIADSPPANCESWRGHQLVECRAFVASPGATDAVILVNLHDLTAHSARRHCLRLIR